MRSDSSGNVGVGIASDSDHELFVSRNITVTGGEFSDGVGLLRKCV